MKQVNPEITKKFLEEIKNQKSEIIFVDGVKIKTCKNVFPPKSEYSQSSEKLRTIFDDMNGKKVLDIGTGTGIQAIHAAIEGASSVLAVDINPDAILCARKNMDLNNVADKVEVKVSDLFDSIQPSEKFDTIIANLPITNFPLSGMVESSLYDPDYRLHNRFFQQAKKFLNPGGYIIMSHIDFNGPDDFVQFENMVVMHGFQIKSYTETVAAGYRWRKYSIIVNNK